MQILWKAPVSLEEYVALAKAVEFPVPGECPACKKKVNLKRHGWYLRYAAREDLEVQVWIPRLLYPACGRTISLLPSSIVPRFQRNPWVSLSSTQNPTTLGQRQNREILPVGQAKVSFNPRLRRTDPRFPQPVFPRVARKGLQLTAPQRHRDVPH